MKEKGFTQHKLAEAVDISEPSVYSYYHGFTTPRLDVLVAIAKVFDVTTDYLLGLEDFNAKERFVNGIAVTKTGWDADDEICCPICGCSVARNVNGASALLYGDVLKDFANKKGTDMYILPSSIHEVILLPSDRINDPTKLLSMVHDVNTTVVSIGDVLSDSVYYYDRKTDHITVSI